MSMMLQIPEPCHENWDEMVDAQGGRHCLVCTKTVMDFTNYTDEQLLDYFKKPKNQNTCGRFYGHQLDKELIPLTQRRFQWAGKFFAGVALIFTGFFNQISRASNSKQKIQTEQLNLKISELSKQQNGGISGRVLDENGLPINEAMVHCKNNKSSVLTDANGIFYLNFIPANTNTLIELEITKTNYSVVIYESEYKDLPERIEVDLLYNPKPIVINKDSGTKSADSLKIKETSTDSAKIDTVTMREIKIIGNKKYTRHETTVGVINLTPPVHRIIRDMPNIKSDALPLIKVTPDIPDLRVTPMDMPQ